MIPPERGDSGSSTGPDDAVRGRGSPAPVLGILLPFLWSCWGNRNHGDGPGVVVDASPPPVRCDTLESIRVVSYNIAFGRKVDAAIEVLRTSPVLRDANVVLLQEMDGPGATRIARALGMSAVYYPAIHRRRTRRDFGNAVLSRCPLTDGARIVLPHRSRYAGTQRIATAATLRVGDRAVRVYSVHLGTVADVSGGQRRAQLDAVLRDARRYPAAVVGGDMNTSDLDASARESGFAWITQRNGRTTRFGRWDHVLTHGLPVGDPPAAGVEPRGRVASDHAAIWAIVHLPP